MELISRIGIDVVREASVPDAAVDADARQYAPTCCPGTREQHISDITDWATGVNGDQSQRLLWMWGPAGVGKSALAQTCAEQVEEMGNLGAAFFFSINGRKDHRPFFVTLAYQLSTVLPDYREVLDTTVYNDKTMVTKKMASQFDSLIVQPVQMLEKQGKAVRQKAIFIDGLDECENTRAQEEIIKLIATSVRTQSTPFRWAIFSRAESHIRSTFEHELISPTTRIVELPIRSPDDDHQIEIFLRHEFRNILRRRNLPLTLSWPSDNSIKALVKATGGLFAYAAAVLRYIDLSKVLRLQDALQDVLNSVSHGGSGPFAGLDAFYMLIMERIPENILFSAQLLLYYVQRIGFKRGAFLAGVCNQLGLSQFDFLGVYQYLHAVLTVQESHEPLVLPNNVDSSCSSLDQRHLYQRTPSFHSQVFGVHGVIKFHHKSFYDFLCDPARSTTFCVTTPAIRTEYFDCLVQCHDHFAQSYVISGNSALLFTPLGPTDHVL
jgi:hypothetical protein